MGECNLVDCVFFLKGDCKRQQKCRFRHQPSAQETSEVCTNWLLGTCRFVDCPKRHPDVKGTRNTIPMSNKAIIVQLLEKGFARADAIMAAEQSSDLQSALIFLQQNCAVCSDTFPHSRMFCFIYCQHVVCRKCATLHLENQIKNHSVVNVVCPFPKCTELQDKSDREVHEYFSLLIPQVKTLLSEELVELLEKKIRDWSLSKNPNFLWCPQCENGIIIDDKSLSYVQCDSCSCRICPRCNEKWSEQHVGISCKRFKMWVENNNPSKQTDAVVKLLGNFGIECPRCKSKYVKSSGGCLHFTCPNCKYQFCEGCLNQFYHPGECPQLKCGPQGFHAHHPRNCFYYLRDWEPTRLQRLLTSKNVEYETVASHNGKTCPLPELKEQDNGKVSDEECGEAVEPNSAGLCRKHYIQYLGWLILKNKLDPLPLYTIEELEQILTKCGSQLPAKTANYHELLITQVAHLRNTGSLSDTNTISESFASLLNLKEKHTRIDDNCDDTDCDDYDDFDNSEGVGYYVKPAVPPRQHQSPKEDYDDYEYEDDEEEDDDEDEDDIYVGGAVGGIRKKIITGVNTAELKSGWSCNFCTFINPLSSKICAACCRSRLIGFEDYEINFDGIECITCTLLNDENARFCAACETPLAKMIVQSVPLNQL